MNCDSGIPKCGRLKIGDIIFNDGDIMGKTPEIVWTNSVEAFIAPTIADGSVEKDNANGLHHGQNTYGKRSVFITGSITSDSVERKNELKRKMDATLSNVSFYGCDNAFKEIIFSKDGVIMKNRARIIDGINWIYRNDTSIIFSFTLALENYYFSGCETKCIKIQSTCSIGNLKFNCNEIGEEVEQCVFEKKTTVNNLMLPFSFKKKPKMATPIDNIGTYQSHMKIRINGKCKNPVIGNLETGQEARFEVDLSEKGVLEIDTEKYSIINIGKCSSSNSINLLQGELPVLIQGVNNLYIYDDCCSEFTADILFSESFI